MDTTWGCPFRYICTHYPVFPFFNLPLPSQFWFNMFSNSAGSAAEATFCKVTHFGVPADPPEPVSSIYTVTSRRVAFFIVSVVPWGATSAHTVVKQLSWSRVIPTGSWMFELPSCLLTCRWSVLPMLKSTLHGSCLNIRGMRRSSLSMRNCAAWTKRSRILLTIVLPELLLASIKSAPFKFWNFFLVITSVPRTTWKLVLRMFLYAGYLIHRLPLFTSFHTHHRYVDSQST